MNRDEAKLILQAYRPGGQDAADAYFAEVLALAQRDPELAAWFAEQQEFDAQVSGSLQQVRLPTGLKALILAQNSSQNKIVALPVEHRWSWLTAWNSPVPWTMAAVVVILIGLASLHFQLVKRAQFAFVDFQKQMLGVAEDAKHHVDMHNPDLQKIQSWLAQHQGIAKLDLPAAMSSGAGVTGCRVLDWRGQKVSMLCFVRDDAGHMDLFVTKRAGISDAPLELPQFAKLDRLTAASWSRGEEVYLLLGEADATMLQKLLAARNFHHLFSAANPQKNFLE